ncbi:MAG TPA: ABC transporter permease, partial [Vicinamibacterales bacterium]|nr:ABC transporter permease [Vicinamibacterales bacterium]
MLHDLRFAARLLQRNPGFAAAAILTIALGVGLNVAVFTLVRAVLLRPLPFTDPDRVVAVYEPYDGPARSRDDTSPLPLAAGQVQDWHRLSSPFSDLAAVQLWQHDVSSRIDWLTDGRAERLRGAYATPNFFSLLGMRAALGRTFTPEDSRESLTQSVVLSNRAWRRLFGADSSVIGRTLSVATGRSRARGAVTVIGVLPPEFHYTYPEETEIWLPLTWDEVYRDPRGGLAYQVVARLNPGVSARAAA